MIFFSDALDGHTVTPTPAGASVCFDKKVRTGLTSAIGTPLNVSLSWTPAVAYDAVVLVFKNATRWRIEPIGLSEQTGMVTAAERQFVYQPFEVINGTGLTVRLDNGGILSEIYVLKEFLDMSANADRPMRYRNFGTDPGAEAYRTDDETLISYAGLSPYGKADILVGWDYLSKARVESFRNLFYGPPLRKPFFIYPEPTERPNEVFRVYWDSCLDRVGERYREVNGFAPYPSASSLASGYTLDAHLIEI